MLEITPERKNGAVLSKTDPTKTDPTETDRTLTANSSGVVRRDIHTITRSISTGVDMSIKNMVLSHVEYDDCPTPLGREINLGDHFSIGDAENFLLDKGINLDLQSRLKKKIQRMIRRGALTKGDADAYLAQFDLPGVVTERDLEQLVKFLNGNPDIEKIEKKLDIIFVIDNLTPQEAWKKWIVQQGIPHKYLKSFSEYKKIDPKTREVLKNQYPTGKAGIVFVPKENDALCNSTKISVEQQLIAMANGQAYLGPLGWMSLFCDQLDDLLEAYYAEKEDIYTYDPDLWRDLIKRAFLNWHKELLPFQKKYSYLGKNLNIKGTCFPNMRSEIFVANNRYSKYAVPNFYFVPYYPKIELGAYGEEDFTDDSDILSGIPIIGNCSA